MAPRRRTMLESEMALIWIVIALILAVAEVATTALFAAFLAAGAIAAVAFAVAGQSAIAQTAAFAAVSLLGIAVARPWLQRRLGRRPSAETVSGAMSMIGDVATVVDTVAGLTQPALKRRGHVRILGENWLAATDDSSILPAGTLVEVVAIEGSTLVVQRTGHRAGHPDEVAATPALT